jgi:DNA invertase Pin-like site-specific DNA recombinase
MEVRTAKTDVLRAAQYVRMSTEHQQYSTENQSEAIAQYAASHGMSVVQSYVDAGKSGLKLAGRNALQELIRTVESGRADFDRILVYDISRWGRFQDADESAYYEYICKRAGITIHYCVEPFENDNSPPSNLIKALKRTMAGEYSRELSCKVFAGHAHLVELGFRQGGPPGYGLRRLLIDRNRVPKAILGRGEYKNIQTDRVILVPGPTAEVAVVREIFHLFTKEGKTEREIADLLNARGVRADMDRSWTPFAVQGLLVNPKYIGANVYNRRSFKLKKKRVDNPREIWLWRDNAFEPLISKQQFRRAEAIIQSRSRYYTEEEMLDGLRRLLARKGRLSSLLINKAKDLASSTTYIARFGGVLNAYKLIGYTPLRKGYNEVRRRIRDLYGHHLNHLITQLELRGIAVDHNAATHLLTINREFTAALTLLRCRKTRAGNFRWLLSLARSVPDITLAARLGPANQSVLDYFLLPGLDVLERQIRFAPDNAIGLNVYRFDDLSAFICVARRTSIKEVS